VLLRLREAIRTQLHQNSAERELYFRNYRTIIAWQHLRERKRCSARMFCGFVVAILN